MIVGALLSGLLSFGYLYAISTKNVPLAIALSLLMWGLYATVAPPGSTDVPIKIGTITFGVTIISAIAAWSARETFRIRLNDLGDPNAVPMPKSEYDRMRARSIAVASL